MVERGTATVTNGQVTSFSVSETRKFAYLGGSVIQELNSSNQVVKEYLRGLDLGGGIGGIIYQKKGADYYHYHYNHKGDVVALTDGNGELAAYYEYDAWGNMMTEAEKSGVDNPYRHSTKEWDEHSGLYYFGARYYYPKVGRWTRRDPAGTVDGLNLYLYARNSPIALVDALGYFSRECCEIAKNTCFAWAYLATAKIIFDGTNPAIPKRRRIIMIQQYGASILAVCGAAILICSSEPESQAEIRQTMQRVKAKADRAVARLRGPAGSAQGREPDYGPKGPYYRWPPAGWNPFKPFEPVY